MRMGDDTTAPALAPKVLLFELVCLGHSSNWMQLEVGGSGFRIEYCENVTFRACDLSILR